MRVEVVRVAVETAGVMEEARVAAARVGDAVAVAARAVVPGVVADGRRSCQGLPLRLDVRQRWLLNRLADRCEGR